MADFEPRRASPRQSFGYTTAAGEQRELRADAKGVVRPQTAEDKAALDTFDLPVTRPPAKRAAKKRTATKPQARGIFEEARAREAARETAPETDAGGTD